MRLFRHFLFIGSLLIANLAIGQSPVFYSFNEQYDWDVETVYDLYHAQNGCVWLGTAEGLFRFNGSDFARFAIPGFQQEYTAIHQDIEGRIWFKNFTGQLFYVEHDSIHLFTTVKNFESTAYFSVALFPTILIANNTEIYAKDFHSGAETTIGQGHDIQISERGQSASNVVFSSISGTDSLWRLNQEQVLVAQTDGVTVETLFTKCIGTGHMFTCHVHHSALLFVQKMDTKTLLSRIENGVEDTLTVASGLGLLDIQNSTVLPDGTVAMCSRRGYYNCSDNRGRTGQQAILPNVSVSTVQKDAFGNTWVSSTNSGVYIAPSEEITATRLPVDEVLHACNDTSGNAWVVDFDGEIFELNSRNADMQLLATEPRAIGQPFWNGYRHELYLSAPKKIVDLRTGAIEFSMALGHCKDILFLQQGVMVACATHRADIVWHTLRCDSSALPLGLKPNDFRGPVDDIRAKTLRLGRFHQANYDRQSGIVYISSTDGLYAYTSAGEQPVLLNEQPVAASTAVSDAASGLWAVTTNNAVVRVYGTTATPRFEVTMPVERLLQWQNYLLLIGKSAVVKLDTVSGIASTIDYRDGLHDSPIKHAFVYRDTLRLLTKHHLQKVPCTFDGTNRHAPKSWIESVVLFETPLPRDSMYVLAHDENNLTVRFGAFDSKSRNSYTYEYRMAGISDQWITNSATEPYARFPKLLPGHYRFELRACNEDGFCSALQTIQLVIHAPFYQRWWFYVLSALSLGLLTSLVIRWRTHRVREREKLLLEQTNLKKEISQAKIASIRAQMNPHFMFNALNSIQKFIVTNEKDIASEYLSDFADLMRKYLDQSKFATISLREEIETLTLYLSLERLRFDEVLTCDITVVPPLDPDNEVIPVMLLQPFIENSLKHGLLSKKGRKHLTVRFEHVPDGYSCTITDNGIGRARSQELNKHRQRYQSFATTAIEQRLQLMNAERTRPIRAVTTDLYDSNNKPSGTQVVITIPAT